MMRCIVYIYIVISIDKYCSYGNVACHDITDGRDVTITIASVATCG